MGSFKVKLALYFLLLSLLPLAAAFWGFSSVTARSETRRVDARLQAGLRAALAAYQERLDAAQATAEAFAKNAPFQADLEHGDRRGLQQLFVLQRQLGNTPNVRVSTPYGLIVGRVPRLAAERSVEVYSRNGFVGTVTGYVPLDAQLATQLRARSGLGPDDNLAILDNTRIAASSGGALRGRVDVASGSTDTVAVDGARYRVLVAGALGGGARIAVLSPQALIDSAVSSTRTHLLFFLIAALLLVATVAWVEGRSIVRTLQSLVHAAHGIARGRLGERVPVRGRDEFAQLAHAFNDMADQLASRLEELEAERARLRDAFGRIGEALGATHDPAQLLHVMLQTALESTGAAGAILIGDHGERVEVGVVEPGPERIELPLTAGQTSFGTLVLNGPAFTPEQRLTAASLTAQAVVALENARLHSIVEQQALVDPLTGLANRRQCEEALGAELARAERFGAPLTLVFADLDDFKAVNDRYGHPVGDVVLREFAAVLRESVREADVAGRWGGEEFVLLLPGTDGDGGVQLAERIRAALAERATLTPAGAAIRLTCSLGVSEHATGDDAAALVAAADRALYRAKRSGKDQVVLAAPLLHHP